ncbi:UNKNOWN [Stylonychia lemnae]|uniref:Uncharacterized protein n=1 Tax=Stylonychia lemnae TaxID=5949 RepID=A0A078APN4_STYLE|nr:UNKNOWN [Stylonychia lemnae]|eukprot:CDW83267.1 UNKNOWN [Stylonychia lemnae]
MLTKERSILEEDDPIPTQQQQQKVSSNQLNAPNPILIKKEDSNSNQQQQLSNRSNSKQNHDPLKHSNKLVENYSEIDWFDFEMRMRKLVHQLMEPTFKQSTEDRALVSKLQRFLEDHDRRVNDIEIILFKKDEEERMGLFDSIYKKITENERQRLMEEEKLRDEIAYVKNEISGVVFSQLNLNRSLKNQEDQTLGLNKEFQEFNNRIRKWQEDFLEKYSKQYNSLLGEISEIREKNIVLDNGLFKKEQEIRRLQNHIQQLQKQVEGHDAWLHKMQDQINDIDKRKCDIVDVNKDLKNLDSEIDKIKLDVDNHGNHFAMVENFVEKYIPIRIQSTISEVLSVILPYKEKNKLGEFEKKRFAELHQIILEDDGIPRLAEQLKQIRMKMEERPYQSKKKLMAMVRRGDYVSINSSSKHGGSVFNDGASEASNGSKLLKRQMTLSSSSNMNPNDGGKHAGDDSGRNRNSKAQRIKLPTQTQKVGDHPDSVRDKANLLQKPEIAYEDSPSQRQRLNSQQKDRDYGHKELSDFTIEVKRQRRASVIRNPISDNNIVIQNSVKNDNQQTIKEEDSSKGVNSDNENHKESRSTVSYDIRDEPIVHEIRREESSEEDEDEDEDMDDYYQNSRINQKLHEINIQTQKLKYFMDDQVKNFRVEIDQFKEKSLSSTKELDQFVQSIYADLQNLLETRKREKQDMVADMHQQHAKVDELLLNKDYVNTSLIQISTIVIFLILQMIARWLA